LLSSLQKLGHHHLLEVYLRGFAVQYPSHFLDLSEFQYSVRFNCSPTMRCQLLIER
jgi:hypothetical protein